MYMQVPARMGCGVEYKWFVVRRAVFRVVSRSRGSAESERELLDFKADVSKKEHLKRMWISYQRKWERDARSRRE
jgi:hypothetical protein